MPRSMKLLAIFFVAALAAAGGYFLMRQPDPSEVQVPVATADKVPTLDKPVAEKGTAKAGARVLVRRSEAQLRPTHVRLKGRTAPARTVSLRAETSGVVSRTPVELGDVVSKGDLLCGLEDEAARLALGEAKARLAAAKLEHEKDADLVKGGWKDPVAEVNARAEVESAQAEQRAAELELEKTRIRAPFDGLIDERRAEVGELLETGDICARLLEMDPILAVVGADADQAAMIKEGAKARVRMILADGSQMGEQYTGEVRFAASDVDPVTGLYRVEVAVPNPEMALRAAQSVEVRIEVGAGLAHLVNPGTVGRAEDGHPQVRYVGVDNKVKIADVLVLDSQLDGVWVAGLPEQALVIVEGQGDLPDGMPVDVAYEDENT